MTEIWNLIAPWFFGLVVVAWLIGDVIVRAFLALLRWYQKLPKEDGDTSTRPVPPGLMGAIERILIALLTVLSPIASPAFAGGWLVLKMSTNWNRSLPEEPVKATQKIRRSQAAMLAGLISISIGIGAGLLIRATAFDCVYPTSCEVADMS